MRRLVEAEVVLKSLRTAHALYDTQCLRGYSLFDAYLTLQSGGISGGVPVVDGVDG